MGEIYIIGAGMAGLAAAVKLASAGHASQLCELAGHAGGRCRSYHDARLDREIDNGNHLILGSNRATLDYIDLIGAREKFSAPETRTMYRFVDAATGHSFAYPFPGAIPGVSARDTLPLLRLLFCAGKHAAVSQMFAKTSPLFQRCIEPLTLAALNTHPRLASARMLRNILIRTLLAGKAGGRAYLSTCPLSHSLITPALEHIDRAGGHITYQMALKHLTTQHDRITALQFNNGTITLRPHDCVILALPSQTTTQLLPELSAPTGFTSILNVHFAWEQALNDHPPHSFLGVLNSPLHWIFFKPGLISTTTSAANHLPAVHGKPHDALAELIWREVCAALHINAPLPDHRVVVEKRATFAATPKNALLRPDTHTPYRNAFLAGDWTNTGLPATLESAIISGFSAAEGCMDTMRKS